MEKHLVQHVHNAELLLKCTYVVFVLAQMRIYVADISTTLNSIDAVAVQSKPNHGRCRSCDRPSYVITRQPPFAAASDVETDEKVFVDT